MSRYLPRAVLEVPFDGDTVTISIDRISMKDAMTLSDVKGTELEAVLRTHNIALNVKDAHGNVVNIDTVFKQFYFHPLVAAATELLMGSGSVVKGDAGPLGQSLPSVSQGASFPTTGE